MNFDHTSQVKKKTINDGDDRHNVKNKIQVYVNSIIIEG